MLLAIFPLIPAPKRKGAVLPTKANRAMYALDESGKTITGLNLAGTGLTDEQWKYIVGINGLAESLELLNLNENKSSNS